MLGALRELEGRLEEALREHERAVELEPDSGTRHTGLSSVLRKLGREAEAAEHLARARELMADATDYNKACIESIAGNADAALAHLAQALERAPGRRDWARRDPDLAFIRDDARFRELVGEE
jgi:tetratricopeptide (TPR) repeat protein